MTLTQILILAAFAFVIGRLSRGRILSLLAISALVIFWFQPPNASVPSLEFWIPVATLSITALIWAITTPSEGRGLRQNWPALLVLGACVLLVDMGRFIHLEKVFTAFTPLPLLAFAALIGIAIIGFLLVRVPGANRFFLTTSLLGLIFVFAFLKAPSLAHSLFVFVSERLGRPLDAGISFSFGWLGYSYLAFRLIHTIRDRQTGNLPVVSLAEFINYVIFFPSFTAGPIDRLERFVLDLRSPAAIKNEDYLFAGRRLAVGLFRKFVVADLLALISITDPLVAQTRSGGWLWLLLYAYTIRIYFDFSGYTDIAIGIAGLMGIRLPENFAAPYFKQNLTQFWNSWHMTLTQWFRAYFFNPLTRFLRSHRNLPTWLVILFTQVSTMILIGLWHGVTWNFVLWGTWHGVGLFIQNRWSDFVRGRMPAWSETGPGKALIRGLGLLVTFHFVALGLVFFALSTPKVSWQALLKLFGVS